MDGGGPGRAALPYVMLVCSGLDHARRGFESFARECFEALRDDPGLHIELVKGSGPSGFREHSVRSLRRDHAVAQQVGRAVGARPFRLEAVAFAFSLLPLLVRRRPHVVYLSEWDTARVLARVRAITSLRFKLVVVNGGFAAEGFEHLDGVQELTPAAREYVLARGADPWRHVVLPYGFRIAPELRILSATDRLSLRDRLGLPTDRSIVVSIAALNRRHKRLDYVIDEVASLPEPRPFLLMVGEADSETPSLRSLAVDRLGPAGHRFLTVTRDGVTDILNASDLFVLASLVEAQGRVLVEAMAQGLRCIAHDSAVTRFALGEWGVYGDLSQAGSLCRMLRSELVIDPAAGRERAIAAHQHVYERFSWDRLKPRYVEFLTEIARIS